MLPRLCITNVYVYVYMTLPRLRIYNLATETVFDLYIVQHVTNTTYAYRHVCEDVLLFYMHVLFIELTLSLYT